VVTFVSNPGLANVGDQIFNETFVPAGYWSLGENEFSNIYIADGRLTIKMKMLGAIAWAFNGYAGDNFYYQGTVQPGACQLGDYYGLVLRAQTDDNLILFGLSCDGSYRVVRRLNGEFQTLLDFVFTPEAVVGSEGTNLLAVRAEGNQLSLFINDRYLTRLDLPVVNSGFFGVFAKSATTSNLGVYFDDLSAWKLNP
jgi:hypothetical protein